MGASNSTQDHSSRALLDHFVSEKQIETNDFWDLFFNFTIPQNFRTAPDIQPMILEWLKKLGNEINEEKEKERKNEKKRMRKRERKRKEIEKKK